VAILGWAFINDSDDARNTPSEVYRDLLLKDGARVEVHDPHVLDYPNVPISHDLGSVLKGQTPSPYSPATRSTWPSAQPG